MSEQRREVLAGRRVVVTRARRQAADLGDRLTALGAEVIYCPAIQIAPPVDYEPLRRAVEHLDAFDWIVLTSVNGVEALLSELERQGRTARDLSARHVACVGPTTAAALLEQGVQVDAMPAEFVGSEIAAVLQDSIRAGQRRVLLARGAGGDAELPERLRGLRADVTDVEAYRSVPDREGLDQVQALFATRSVDVITFTSPSTVTFFLEATGSIPADVRLAVIGPVTAARLRDLHLQPDIVAQDHTIPGLVRAISQFFGESREDNR